MQIVIDISEDSYKATCNGCMLPPDVKNVVEAIKDGTLLPKGHGDLVDRDGINSRFNAIYDELESLSCEPAYKELLDKLSMCLDMAEPVIKENYEETEEELWK